VSDREYKDSETRKNASKDHPMKKRLLHGFVFLMLLTFLFCHSYALDTVSIEATRIKDNIYRLLVDDFVNMVAFIGPNGVLLVDTGFDESSGEVKSILTKLGGGEIKYIINTHSDYDHIAGNSALREKAIVMAHTRCKSRLIQYADPEYDIPFDKALFRNAYPTITVDDTIKLYFNGEEIQIIPLTGGHTDEDIIVYFKNLGVVCLGDVIIPGSFPVVKNENGGNAHALLKNVERLITLFPDDVIFIVGHGHDMTVKELRSYHDMLRSTISIVNEAMKENMTVDEMKQMNILEDWSSFDNPKYRVTTSEAWIETIFRSSEDKRQEIKIQTLTGPYLGQEPPGMNAEIFAPGIVSTDDNEVLYGFFNDATLFIFERSDPNFKGDWIYIPVYSVKLEEGEWTQPVKYSLDGKPWFHCYTDAPAGISIFFAWKKNLDGSGPPKDIEIWKTVREGENWSDPQNLGFPVNTDKFDSWPSLTKDDTLYFFSTREGGYGGSDLYRSRPIKDEYFEVQNLGTPINTEYFDHDPFISPDEDYLIWCSNRPGGLGVNDLFVSFRKNDGTWTIPQNMGEGINSDADDTRPYVTPDGKYLFFNSDRSGNRDIYWADARFIDEIRNRILGASFRESEYLKKIVNDGYGDYLLVPAGEFEMGDNFNEGNPDELPVHKIYLSDYYIGKYEVTNREYKQFMDDGGYKNPAFWTAGGFGEFGTQPLYWDNNTDADPRNGQRGTTFYKGRNVHGGGIPGHENFPVNGVSWYEAMAYCSWLSSKTGQKYRLPTEAEWEKAARGSYEQNRDNPELRHQRRYPWGDDFDNSYGNFWNSGDPFDNGTAPAGYYDGTKHGPYQTKDNASPYGAYDMAGNVFEWCLDFYVRMNKDNPHSSVDYLERFDRGTVNDPRGPSSGEEACLRSSDWHHNGVSENDKYYHNPRSAFRNFDPPHWRGANFGFRCVREK
jgi:formylglycine-generating enzyme required for sulfatase activity/glyoxylase-like metal-dependent hydrolase (beta-lactamase superfamily II)